MTKIAERLVFLRGSVTQAEFAQRMGINVNTLRAYEKGRAMPGFEVLESLCTRIGVSPVWILTGEGAVYNATPPRIEEPIPLEEPQVHIDTMLERRDMKTVTQSLPGIVMESREDTFEEEDRLWDREEARVEERAVCDVSQPSAENGMENASDMRLIQLVDARMLTGSDVPQSEQMYAFRRDFLERKGDPDQMVLIRASGNDMEPEIFDNDMVLVELMRHESDGIIPGRLYAVGFDGAIYLKRIDILPGKMILRGVSPKSLAIEFDTLQGRIQGFRVVGRVLWSCHEYN